jgi:acetyl esterase
MSVTESETLFNGCRVVRLVPLNPKGTMVWFHGGGWMIELGEDAVQWGRDLAARTGLTVLMPDYPLAREFAYPKSNAWCVEFWRHCLQAEPGPVYLGGDSAGAHLALCSLPAGMPEKALFIYAVTTLLPIRDSGSWAAFKKGWPLSPRLMDYFYDAYCPDKEARYGASPLEQLSLIPPTLLITAADDILADQQIEFARRFNAQQLIYEGAGHIFLSRAEGTAFRARALEDAAAFLA